MTQLRGRLSAERDDCDARALGSLPIPRPGGARRPRRGDGWHPSVGHIGVAQHRVPAGPPVRAVPIMAVYLWLFWLYVRRGEGWPQSTAAARRASSRANGLPADLWGPALLAGVLGLVSVLLLQGVLGRLVAPPPATRSRRFTLPHPDRAAMGAHERSRRGCGRGDLIPWLHAGADRAPPRAGDRDPGDREPVRPPAFHAPGGHAFVLLPYYMAAAAVYGALAHLTDSTLPSMVLHGGGNVFSAVDLFTRGRSEWHSPRSRSPSSGRRAGSGVPGQRWALLVVGAATVWRVFRASRASGSGRTPGAA